MPCWLLELLLNYFLQKHKSHLSFPLFLLVSVAEASPSLAEATPRPESTVMPSGADGVQTSSAVRPSSHGSDEAGIGQQR